MPWQDAAVPAIDGTGVKLAEVYDPNWIRQHRSPNDPDYDPNDPASFEYAVRKPEPRSSIHSTNSG